MTVFVVGTYGRTFGTYKTEELAQEACAYAQYSEEMSGGFNIYVITEMEVKETAPRVPEEYRKMYCKKSRPIRRN